MICRPETHQVHSWPESRKLLMFLEIALRYAICPGMVSCKNQIPEINASRSSTARLVAARLCLRWSATTVRESGSLSSSSSPTIARTSTSCSSKRSRTTRPCESSGIVASPNGGGSARRLTRPTDAEAIGAHLRRSTGSCTRSAGPSFLRGVHDRHRDSAHSCCRGQARAGRSSGPPDGRRWSTRGRSPVGTSSALGFSF